MSPPQLRRVAAAAALAALLALLATRNGATPWQGSWQQGSWRALLLSGGGAPAALRLARSGGAAARAAPRGAAEPPLAFQPGQEWFKIVQVADTQLGDRACAGRGFDARGGRELAALLRDEEADGGIDLVVHTGDVIHGDTVLPGDAGAWAARALAPAARFRVAGVLGNHDAPRRDVLAALRDLPRSVVPTVRDLPAGPAGPRSVYELPVLPAPGAGRAAARLIFLDTGGAGEPEGVAPRTLEWLEALAANATTTSRAPRPPPALLFQHIPPAEMPAAWAARAGGRCASSPFGSAGEPASGAAAPDAARLRDVLERLGVRAAAFGHDHANAACCPVGAAPWWACYGVQGGYGAYYLGDDLATGHTCARWWAVSRRAPRAAPRGVRVFALARDGRLRTHTRLHDAASGATWRSAATDLAAPPPRVAAEGR
ncbi:PAP28 [Scenedesmus sp. PABB004]|nr:PAP28 [Scenedesmus sp. PABB004]